MSGDKLVYDLSNEIEGSPAVFVKKDWLNILDNQNANYSSNQSVIDTSQLSNSNKYMSYREAYLAVPLLLTLGQLTPGATFLPATAGTSADYALGLKNWFGTIIHSFTLDYNGVTLIQQTPFINLWNNFKLLTSLSYADVTTMGASIGFYPDDPTSWGFYPSTAASPGAAPFNPVIVGGSSGQGTCNNVSFVANLPVLSPTTTFNNYNSGGGNIGFLKRQQYINYDPEATLSVPNQLTTTSYSSLFSAASCQNMWKSYVSNKQNGANGVRGYIQISVMATIYLKHIASFFQCVPLLKGVFLKMTLNLNNTSTNFLATTNHTVANQTSYLSVVSVQNAVGGTNPLMVSAAQGLNADGQASAASFSGGINLNEGTAVDTANGYVANISVGAICLNNLLTATPSVGTGQLARSIYLYTPAYTFNPVFEQAYLSSPIKSIKYTDVYQYQVLNQAPNGNFNNLLTNGIADLRSIVIIPFYAQNATIGGFPGATPAGINPATQLPAGIPVYQSPFDTAGGGTTSPLSLLGNFNVVVSGQNAIYNQQRYSFEEWNDQLYGCNAVNSGMTDGLTSGLISQLGFEMNYCYYYVNIGRMLPVEQSVPKSVQIIGQNYSANPLDLYCFLEYGVSVDIDALTGSRV